jgi:hypothetical protein
VGKLYYLIFERPLKQTDEVDFGFRVDNLFGNDWQFTYMQELFNRAIPNGSFAGYDMPQFYIGSRSGPKPAMTGRNSIPHIRTTPESLNSRGVLIVSFSTDLVLESCREGLRVRP